MWVGWRQDVDIDVVVDFGQGTKRGSQKNEKEGQGRVTTKITHTGKERADVTVARSTATDNLVPLKAEQERNNPIAYTRTTGSLHSCHSDACSRNKMLRIFESVRAPK